MAREKDKQNLPAHETGAGSVGESRGQLGEQDAGSMEQLRSILLGPVSKGLEQRLEGIEGRFDSSVLDLVEKTQGHINEIDTRLKDELGRFGETLETQGGSHAEQLTQLRGDLDSGLGELRQKADELGGAFSKLHDELRSELSRHTEQMKQDLDNRTAELRNEIINEVTRLQDALVDRTYLSSLLSEVAIRLNPPVLSDIGDTDPDIDLDHLIGGSEVEIDTGTSGHT